MKKLISSVLICLMLACSAPKTINNTTQETIDSTRTTQEISEEDEIGYIFAVAAAGFIVLSLMILSNLIPAHSL